MTIFVADGAGLWSPSSANSHMENILRERLSDFHIFIYSSNSKEMGKSQFTGCILSFTGAILSAYNFHTLKPAIKLLVLNILVNR